MSRARIDQPLTRQPQPQKRVVPVAHVRPQGGLTNSTFDYNEVRAEGSLSVKGPITTDDTLSVAGSSKLGPVDVTGTIAATGNITTDQNAYLGTFGSPPSDPPAGGVLRAQGNLIVALKAQIESTQTATDPYWGAFMVWGGIAVQDNIHIANDMNCTDAVIGGDLEHTGANAGFFGTAPVAQPAPVADATGAGDVVAQLNALLAAMRSLGLIDT